MCTYMYIYLCIYISLCMYIYIFVYIYMYIRFRLRCYMPSVRFSMVFVVFHVFYHFQEFICIYMFTYTNIYITTVARTKEIVTTHSFFIILPPHARPPHPHIPGMDEVGNRPTRWHAISVFPAMQEN